MPRTRTTITSNDAPAAIGPYSQAIRAGDLVFLSGQIPLNPTTGAMVGDGDPEAEARQVMANLAAVLAAAGGSLADLARTTIYLADLGDFGVVNEVYGSCFEADPPARATVEVAALPKGARVEISGVAYLPQQP
jgi:2-iminobutanoate/2-iminopropanoate deaminase